jgi:uncharacterized protein DUF6236
VSHRANRHQQARFRGRKATGRLRIRVQQIPGGTAITIARPFRDFLAVRGEDLQRRFAMTRTTDGKPFAVYVEKLDRALIKDLEDLELASRRGPWIMMPPRLADIYMTALAEAMAPQIAARPLADQTAEHIAISGLTIERLSDFLLGTEQPEVVQVRKDNEIEQAMVTLAFRHVIPTKIEDIPVEQIIAFRSKYADERHQFQIEIAKIVKELDYMKLMTDQSMFQRDIESAYKTHVAPKVKRLETAMSRSGWDVVESAIGASWAVPAVATGVITTLASVGLVLPAAATGIAAVAFGGWSIYRKYQKSTEDTLKPSAEAYLYRAKMALSPQALVESVRADGRALMAHV